MRKLLVSILMIIVAFPLFASLEYLPSNAYHTLGDIGFSKYGPLTSNLLLSEYSGQEGEYLGFKNGDLDLMPRLTVSQVKELNLIDPLQNTYKRPSYVERNVYGLELNNKLFPTDNLAFRKALSYCMDKTRFISEALSDMGIKLDSPLGWSTKWYNPYCTDLYGYNLQLAVTTLIGAGFYDHDSDGFIEGPTGQKILLKMITCQDRPDDLALGAYFQNALTVGLKGQDWGAHLSAGFQMEYDVLPRQHFKEGVFVGFGFNIATSAIGNFFKNLFCGRCIDSLYFLYSSRFSQAYPYTSNYVGYENPEFDANAEAMRAATTIGDASTPGTAMYHVSEMQRILMDDAAVIPVYTYATAGAYQAGWNSVVNAEGIGPPATSPILTLKNPAQIRCG